ncbi:hypothetical protein MMC29_005306, partial [Sticta canariensis]|nr:hypothetical protein [Sticta canariensis]
MTANAPQSANFTNGRLMYPKVRETFKPHVIHPTGLDSVFRLPLVGLTKGGWKPVPVVLPTLARKLWGSNDLLAQPDLQSVTAYSKVRRTCYRETESDTVALNAMTDEPLIVVEDCRGSTVDSLDAYMNSSLRTTIADQTGYHSIYVILLTNAKFACLYFLWDANETVSEKERTNPSNSHGKYIAWMGHHCNQDQSQALLSSPEMNRLMDDKQYRERYLHNLENSSVEGKLVVLRGEIDTLSFLFEGSLMKDICNGAVYRLSYQKVAAYVDLLAHKNPNLCILEIGAGTGGMTQEVLDTLRHRDQPHKNITPRYHQYTYTNISSGFFEEAKKRFSDQGDRLIFKPLDIETDPLVRGFEAGKYDLVIVSCVLHAIENMDVTLTHTRNILKPGGKLVLVESCNLYSSRIPFVFGLLPGWWRETEKHRSLGPLLSEETWRESLSRNGAKHTGYFGPESTYVICGGLGDLGRNIAPWMMNRGARNLLLLSRSGAQDQPALKLLEELRRNAVAANTYQDALARYRVSVGEKYISLNLGLMAEAGFAADRHEVMNMFRSAGYEAVSQLEFFAVLDYCCNPDLGLLPPEHAQLHYGPRNTGGFEDQRTRTNFSGCPGLFFGTCVRWIKPTVLLRWKTNS